MPTSARLGKFRVVQRVQAQFPRQFEQRVRHDLLRRQVCLPPYLFIKVIQKIFHLNCNHFHSTPSLFPVYTIFLRPSDLKKKLLPVIMVDKKGGDLVVDAALIGQILQEYRVKKGMSQELLSGLAGLDRTHYSKIERGLRSPTLDTLLKIAQALEIPPHEIVRTIEGRMDGADRS